MMTREELLLYAKKGEDECGQPPIYAILMIEHDGKERMKRSGGKLVHTGWPDTGSSYEPGYYYSLDDAVDAMHQNVADIREAVYDAGFIIWRFPGLYRNPGREGRMYFAYDGERKGFFEKEEPEILRHFAY